MAQTDSGIPYVGPTERGDPADFPVADAAQAAALETLISTLRAEIAAAKSTAVPLGVIWMWSGAENMVPAGWLLCNGQPHGQSAMTQILGGSAYVPDMTSRFIAGAGTKYGTSTRTYNPRESGEPTPVTGSKTLTAAQVPLVSHSHTVAITGSSTNHLHGIGGYAGWGGGWASDGGHDHLDVYGNNYIYDMDQAGSGTYVLGQHAPEMAIWTQAITGAHGHSGTTGWQSEAAGGNGADTYIHGHATTVTTASAAATSSVDFRPAYYALCFIIKCWNA